MSQDVTIVYKASDQMSANLRTIRMNANDLCNDVAAYKQLAQETFDKRTEVKFEITDAKRNLSDLQKEYRSLNKLYEEGSDEYIKEQDRIGTAMKEQITLIESQTLEYQGLSKVIKEARNEESKLQTERSKNDNENASRTSSATSLTASLSSAGLTNMLGSSLSSYAGQSINSMLGDEAGSMVSSTLSSVISGAAMGSLAGPVGTLVGAGIGLAAGILESAAQSQATKDEIFKSTSQTLYDDIIASKTDGNTSGSAIAASRELQAISFGTQLGSEEKLAKLTEEIETFAAVTPYETNDLFSLAGTFLTQRTDSDDIITQMTKVGDTASALNLGTAEMASIIETLGYFDTTNKVTTAKMNTLTGMGIPALAYLEEHYDKTTDQIYEMISAGELSGSAVSNLIYEKMGEQYSGNMELQALTFSGLESTLTSLNDNMDRAYGEGYNEVRKEGLTEQIDLLSGEMGDALKEVRTLEGQLDAQLENDRELLILQAKQEVMADDHFQDLLAQGTPEATLEMVRLLDEAEAIAIAQSDNSAIALDKLDNQITLLESIKTGVYHNSTEYMDLIRRMEVVESKGMASVSTSIAFASGDETEVQNALIDRINGSHASGLSYVPYDGYLAELHEGEQVLSAKDARNETKNQEVNINNTFTINNSSGNTYEITQEIVAAIASACATNIT